MVVVIAVHKDTQSDPAKISTSNPFASHVNGVSVIPQTVSIPLWQDSRYTTRQTHTYAAQTHKYARWFVDINISHNLHQKLLFTCTNWFYLCESRCLPHCRHNGFVKPHARLYVYILFFIWAFLQWANDHKYIQTNTKMEISVHTHVHMCTVFTGVWDGLTHKLS